MLEVLKHHKFSYSDFTSDIDVTVFVWCGCSIDYEFQLGFSSGNTKSAISAYNVINAIRQLCELKHAISPDCTV